MKPTARRCIAWLLLFALALSSAAPSFAAGLSAAELAALGICSLAAHQEDGAGTQQQDGRGPPGSGLHHCDLCAPAAHAALPPALPALSVAPADLPSFGLPALVHPERPVYAGATWRPRGPPGQA